MAKQHFHTCSNPKIKGYADGGPVYSDSKTMTENLSYPALAASRTATSQPQASEASGGYAEVPGTRDQNTYPAYEDHAPPRVWDKKRKM